MRQEASTSPWRSSLVALTLLFFACTDESGSREALQKAGFTDIEMDGHSWMGCSEEDTFSTSFRAKNPQGFPVEGAVCCGWFKKCTIRF